MAPTREVSIGTMQSLVKLIQESYPQWKHGESCCSQSAMSKILCKYKRLWQASKCQDKKNQSNRKCIGKQMKTNGWKQESIYIYRIKEKKTRDYYN